MNNFDKKMLLDSGYREENAVKHLVNVLNENSKLKEVHISIFNTEPYMLLLNATERQITVKVENKERIVFTQKRQTIINLLIDNIKECLYKEYNTGMYEFQFELCNMRYSLRFMV